MSKSRVYQPPSYSNTNLTATIENITKTNLNRININTLLNELKIDKTTISLVFFGKTICFITFTTHLENIVLLNLI